METRKFLLAVLAAALASGARAEDPFRDVTPDHWARSSIEKVVDRGVLAGYDGRFHGEKLINRYQMAVIAKRIMDADQVPAPERLRPLPFQDVPRTHWCFKALQQAYQAGYLRESRRVVDDPGSQGPTFHGEQLVDRYQFAELIAAHVRRVSPGWAPSRNLEVPEDVPAGHPAHEAIRVALETGVLQLREGRFQGERLVDRFLAAHAIARLIAD